MKLLVKLLFLSVLMLTMTGCASTWKQVYHTESERVVSSSLVNYLVPEEVADKRSFSIPTFWAAKKRQPNAQGQQIASSSLRPLSVGIAFIPTKNDVPGLSEARKAELLDRVKQVLDQSSQVYTSQVIPGLLMRQGSGFQNIKHVAKMYKVDTMALVSYDQVLHTDDNELSLLNWTIIGAYIIPTAQFDTQTLIDVSLFDVASKSLVLRATGTDDSVELSTLYGSVENIRNTRYRSFEQAFDQAVTRLGTEVAQYPQSVNQVSSGPSSAAPSPPVSTIQQSISR